MSPVVLALERALKANAACEPETPAEARFASEVGPWARQAAAICSNPRRFMVLHVCCRQCWVWAEKAGGGTPADTSCAMPVQVLPRLSAAIAALRSPPPEALAKLATQPQVSAQVPQYDCLFPIQGVLKKQHQTEEQQQMPQVNHWHMAHGDLLYWRGFGCLLHRV